MILTHHQFSSLNGLHLPVYKKQLLTLDSFMYLYYIYVWRL